MFPLKAKGRTGTKKLKLKDRRFRMNIRESFLKITTIKQCHHPARIVEEDFSFERREGGWMIGDGFVNSWPQL